jgi:hypothetical protein
MNEFARRRGILKGDPIFSEIVAAIGYLANNHRKLLFEFQMPTESELSAGNGASSER